MKRAKFVLLVFIILLFRNLVIGAIINVPGDQPTIQAGINISSNGDTVLVQPGTYLENLNYNGKNITVASLFLTTLDTTYISQTIIDGSQDSTVVSFESGEDSTAILTGFTIENGNKGISCFNSSPIIQNCIIHNYVGYLDAILIYGESSSPTIKKNKFINNYNGIKISFSQVKTKIVNNLFSNNLNDGISVNQSPSIIEDNEFNSNEKGVFIWCSEVILRDNLFFNSALTGISCYTSSVIIEYNIFDSNPLNGIYCSSGNESSDVTIRKNLIINHTRGILCQFWDGLKIINNSIVDNDYGIVELHSEIFIINNIVYDNIFDFDFYLYSPPPIVAYSCTSDPLPAHSIDGGGNIVSDPLFIDPENGNYHLQENSPCIDAGTAFFEWDGNIIVDIEESEYFGLAPDMGCFESQYLDANEWEIEKTAININNYPNPFNPTTSISYIIPNESIVELSIYNIKGQKIRTLVNNESKKGNHSVAWNGDDESGDSVISGVYLYTLRVNGKIEAVKKCLLLK